MCLDQRLVYVAPSPVFPRLERLDYRVPARVEVLGGVAVVACIATAHVPAAEALPEVDPSVAGSQAFLAPLGADLHVPDLVEMSALSLHWFSFQSVTRRTGKVAAGESVA
jgi:hypothetical protein